MLRFFYMFLVVLIANLGLSAGVQSQTTIVTLDPGPAGAVFKEKTFQFDDLNGVTPGDFNRLGRIEFHLADSKFITVHMNSAWEYMATLSISYSDVTTGFPPITTGYLTDDVDTLYSKDNDGSGSGNLDKYNLKWINWNDPAIEGFTFTKIILPRVTARNYPDGTVVESAQLKLLVWEDASGVMEVGPVPEPDGGFYVVPLPSGGAAMFGL